MPQYVWFLVPFVMKAVVQSSTFLGAFICKTMQIVIVMSCNLQQSPMNMRTVCIAVNGNLTIKRNEKMADYNSIYREMGSAFAFFKGVSNCRVIYNQVTSLCCRTSSPERGKENRLVTSKTLQVLWERTSWAGKSIMSNDVSLNEVNPGNHFIKHPPYF